MTSLATKLLEMKAMANIYIAVIFMHLKLFGDEIKDPPSCFSPSWSICVELLDYCRRY